MHEQVPSLYFTSLHFRAPTYYTKHRKLEISSDNVRATPVEELLLEKQGTCRAPPSRSPSPPGASLHVLPFSNMCSLALPPPPSSCFRCCSAAHTARTLIGSVVHVLPSLLGLAFRSSPYLNSHFPLWFSTSPVSGVFLWIYNLEYMSIFAAECTRDIINLLGPEQDDVACSM